MPPSLHDTIHHPPDRRALLISSITLPRTGASPIFSGLSFDHPCSRLFDLSAFYSLLKLLCLCPPLQSGALPQSGTLPCSSEAQLLQNARLQWVVRIGKTFALIAHYRSGRAKGLDDGVAATTSASTSPYASSVGF
ncbi:hypothetical protein C343_06339 [Cryptococcus neoformans C23]|uniref:Uncharacterized protein n=2 Tax=Cryptococcus neoformans TaxID=5207 RepID=A0A854Q592_CRYNE|nr:hypothetical protein CNAG_07905 [Cryptococcus neoformans var. grubii H99]AUB28497.1 hypothetical protein CKF44_07905 [Cryptococcus neoformans var. grubii]OWZ27169.1 hypothetical protein C347_06339 [Cryptococcus neoformans var. grubii AD2-60a]OWZ29067.1 hypothetical protein C353_06362 [Cryptococcus neoformans var. grubii AD1-83a]OWZ39131.1 hypothetical protein C343_06339 [Cryptococcus neoformans var. grubii C23]OWZ50462.1 hypothetical protein C368_06605 [Cryptococcus neoformans var. grubii 1|eukprot:XP_012053016.1 hypothetical protein CNAG_07905 [Cryptococcus neoformans var. grubii H99]